MQNVDKQTVDLYIPRKCSATNRLITAKDHSSVQISIAHVGPDGVFNHETTTFALCGYIRNSGRSDEALNRLATDAGFLTHVYDF